MLGNQYGVDLGNIYNKYYQIMGQKLRNEAYNTQNELLKKRIEYTQQKMDNFDNMLKAEHNINFHLLKMANPNLSDDEINQMAGARVRDTLMYLSAYNKMNDRQKAEVQQQLNTLGNQIYTIANLPEEQRDEAYQRIIANLTPEQKQEYGFPDHWNDTASQLFLAKTSLFKNMMYNIEQNKKFKRQLDLLSKQYNSKKDLYNYVYGKKAELENLKYNNRLNLLNQKANLDLAKMQYKVGLNASKGSLGNFNSYLNVNGLLQYKPIIDKYADKYGVPKELAYAVVQSESSFNPKAVSNAGAIGLFQLMPNTAKGLGVNPNDVEGNIEGGIKYLKQLLNYYHGDIKKAIMAYNEGMGNVDKGKLFPETKDYLNNVYGLYSKLKSNRDLLFKKTSMIDKSIDMHWKEYLKNDKKKKTLEEIIAGVDEKPPKGFRELVYEILSLNPRLQVPKAMDLAVKYMQQNKPQPNGKFLLEK